MKKLFSTFFFLWLLLPLWAAGEKELFVCSDGSQIVVAHNSNIYHAEYKNNRLSEKKPIGVLNGLLQQGWAVKNVSASFDCREIYFSAKPAGATNYDFYVIRKKQGAWSLPELFASSLNSEADELWLSVASDGQTAYFVRQTEKAVGRRIERKSNLFYAMRTADGQWGEPLMLVFSTGEDIAPRIMNDNKTLLFASKRLTEQKKKNNYALFYAKRISKYDWFSPSLITPTNVPHVNCMAPSASFASDSLFFVKQVCEKKDTVYSVESIALDEQMKPGPVICYTGKVSDAKGKPLQADIYVYNAITSEMMVKYRCDYQGTFRVALPAGYNYKIDFTMSGYSHVYKTFATLALSDNRVVQESVVLNSEVEMLFNVFDKELMLPIDPAITIKDAKTGQKTKASIRKDNVGRYFITMPIGESYEIDFQKENYDPFVFEMDTKKSVLFTQSELDVELNPGKLRLSVRVKDALSGLPLEADVVLSNTDRREVLNAQKADSVGVYSAATRKGDTYRLKVASVGYFYFDSLVFMPKDSSLLTCEVAMNILKNDAKLQIQNIVFGYNSADLTEESFLELDRVVELLEQNPNLTIELSAHTDDRGADAYNERLSLLRANAAMDYIVRKGIARNRITAVGYGKRMPLVPNTSEENRAKNRRVEFKVTNI